MRSDLVTLPKPIIATPVFATAVHLNLRRRDGFFNLRTYLTRTIRSCQFSNLSHELKSNYRKFGLISRGQFELSTFELNTQLTVIGLPILAYALAFHAFSI
jgi:hypothetical protein